MRDVTLSPEETQLLSGYGLLTRKPVLIVLNLADGQEPVSIDYQHAASRVVALQGKLEMELAQLPADEAEEFMHDFGVEELGLSRVISYSYDLLELQSFFTVGEDEVRAWTVKRGATAANAAGTIHSDLQKGFIRAEVVAFADLIQFGSLVEARNRGRLRLEGKDYIVQDGEIMHVRFNV